MTGNSRMIGQILNKLFFHLLYMLSTRDITVNKQTVPCLRSTCLLRDPNKIDNGNI